MACVEERTRPVTLEITEREQDGRLVFQARVRFDGMVIANIGTPQPTELEALDVVTRALLRVARPR